MVPDGWVQVERAVSGLGAGRTALSLISLVNSLSEANERLELGSLDCIFYL